MTLKVLTLYGQASYEARTTRFSTQQGEKDASLARQQLMTFPLLFWGLFLESPENVSVPQKCIGLKLCMKGTAVHVNNIMELNSSAIIRFEILLWQLWLCGAKTFRDLRETSPWTFMDIVFGQIHS